MLAWTIMRRASVRLARIVFLVIVAAGVATFALFGYGIGRPTGGAAHSAVATKVHVIEKTPLLTRQ